MPADADESARQTWLKHLRDQRAFDRELATTLRAAADAGEQTILSIVTDNASAIARRGQLQVAVSQLRRIADSMWTEVNSNLSTALAQQIQLGMDGVREIDSILLRAVGDTELRESIVAATKVAVENAISKQINAFELSQRVYDTQAIANGWVDRVVTEGILLNKSAKEIARDVRRFIRPDVPGGVSYAAKRLARTELNNAFHTTTIIAAADQPWTEGFRWNLSSSHPRPDPCDEYANNDPDGLGVGIFSTKNVPNKPHPQCLCYVTVVTPDEEEFIKGLANGKYDSYLFPDEVPLRTPREALLDYHTNSFKINSDLRAGRETKDVQIIDGMMAESKTTRDTISYRVVDNAEFRSMTRKAGGRTISDKAFVSTTTDRSKLEDFFQGEASERVIMRVIVPKGSHAIDVGEIIGDDPHFFDQSELLIDRDAVFQIIEQKVTPQGLNVSTRLMSTRQSRLR